MKKTFKQIALVLASAFLVLSFSGCKNEPDEGTTEVATGDLAEESEQYAERFVEEEGSFDYSVSFNTTLFEFEKSEDADYLKSKEYFDNDETPNVFVSFSVVEDMSEEEALEAIALQENAEGAEITEVQLGYNVYIAKSITINEDSESDKARIATYYALAKGEDVFLVEVDNFEAVDIEIYGEQSNIIDSIFFNWLDETAEESDETVASTYEWNGKYILSLDSDGNEAKEKVYLEIEEAEPSVFQFCFFDKNGKALTEEYLAAADPSISGEDDLNTYSLDLCEAQSHDGEVEVSHTEGTPHRFTFVHTEGSDIVVTVNDADGEFIENLTGQYSLEN